MSAPLKRPGETLAWLSHDKAKRGVVRAIVPAGEDARAVLARLGVRAELMSQVNVARGDRYLVEVQRPTKLPAMYAPAVCKIDKDLREQQRGAASSRGR